MTRLKLVFNICNLKSINLQTNHLYPAYWSAENLQINHLYPAYWSAENLQEIYISLLYYIIIIGLLIASHIPIFHSNTVLLIF